MTRRQVSALSSKPISRAALSAAVASATYGFTDTSDLMTTVDQGNGLSTTYLADGTTFCQWQMSVASNGDITATATMYDGSQYSSTMPPISAFAPNGTTTVGNCTLNANSSTNTYTATVQTSGGPVTITTGQNADGSYYQSTQNYGKVTIASGAYGWMQPQYQSGLTTTSSSKRSPEYWGDAGCYAAIALLFAIIAAIIAAFWYLGPIVALFAAKITAAISAAEAAAAAAGGTLTLTGPVTVPAGTAFASLIAAFIAAAAGTFQLIAAQCAARPTPTPSPTPTPTATPTATPSPTATPKPTATPSASPKPSASPSATAKPSASPPATSSPVPSSPAPSPSRSPVYPSPQTSAPVPS